MEALRELDGVGLEGDLRWQQGAHVWAFPFRVRVDVPPGPLVPETTSWWAHLHSDYPAGRPKFYPAKRRGLVYTFFHQEANLDGPERQLWREGAPCLHHGIAAVRQLGDSTEPRAPELRLRWYAEQLRHWLLAAARGELMQPGELLELPDYRFGQGHSLAFFEPAASWSLWSAIEETCGYARTLELGEGPLRVWIIAGFENAAGRTLVTAPQWRPFLSNRARGGPLAVWVRTPEVPVVPPWQAPSTWQELVAAMRAQAIDLPNLLWPLIEARLRTRQKREWRSRHPLLIGFPMAARLGQPPKEMCWVGFALPPLAGIHEARAGFRPAKRGRWLLDVQNLLGMKPLPWMRSQAWMDRDLTGRGRLRSPLPEQRVLLIGAGALGSSVAELLVRGGVRSLCLFDGDRVEAGNLVRHTLTLEDLERNKAEAVAARLNRLSPHAHAVGVGVFFTDDLPSLTREARSLVAAADLVIDCSADDPVLYAMERFAWETERTFVCLSLGILARRLYCFLARGRTFPRQDYVRTISPWVARDWEGVDEAELPREGTGCWHPLMPATTADVWLLAATAVRSLETALSEGVAIGSPRMDVFEQVDGGGAFRGVQRAPPGPA